MTQVSFSGVFYDFASQCDIHATNDQHLLGLLIWKSQDFPIKLKDLKTDNSVFPNRSVKKSQIESTIKELCVDIEKLNKQCEACTEEVS
uniref:Type II toxin-antitoxin system PemK/MazF family toxin n=1 Tax=Rhabditophanes sp. KR3021 TaxID=114890 RepID=A0AC35UD25_9BILA